MFCKKCGSNIPEDETECPYCGEHVDGVSPKKKEVIDVKEEDFVVNEKEMDAKEAEEIKIFPEQNIYEKKEPIVEPSFTNFTKEKPIDNGSVWYGVLGFFFPLVGLILFLVWRKEKPTSAKHCGIGALIGVILEIVLVVPLTCCCMSVNEGTTMAMRLLYQI